jgi:hypothetical protein
MKSGNLEKVLIEKIEDELRKKGVSTEEFDPKDVKLKKSGNKIKINYKDIEIVMPAPSQEAIDSWWKEAGKYITGGIIVLAGVAVGGWVASKSQD